MKDFLTIKQKLLILAFSAFMTTSISGGVLFLFDTQIENSNEYISNYHVIKTEKIVQINNK